MEDQSTLICGKCGIPLVSGKAGFTYLNHSFSTAVLRCTSCGMVFIPEELARGRMAEVEQTLEDK